MHSEFRNNTFCLQCFNQGVVGLTRWMSSIANQRKEGEGPNGEEDMKLCIMVVGDNQQP
ncbi:hypothetical protein Hanom_Chr16g01447151 [Helianthus anomalus]